MAWFDDTDGLVLVKYLRKELRNAKRKPNGGVKICEEVVHVATLCLDKLELLLQNQSLECTCKTRLRGRSLDFILGT